MNKHYKIPKITPTCLNINESTEGETIEQKMERILTSNEPIQDGAPIIYTERKDGVNPSHNIRTDKWDYALEGMDKYAKSIEAQRNSYGKKPDDSKVIDLKPEGGESTQATE